MATFRARIADEIRTALPLPHDLSAMVTAYVPATDRDVFLRLLASGVHKAIVIKFHQTPLGGTTSNSTIRIALPSWTRSKEYRRKTLGRKMKMLTEGMIFDVFVTHYSGEQQHHFGIYAFCALWRMIETGLKAIKDELGEYTGPCFEEQIAAMIAAYPGP
jgi:hypothetical protein